jgi:hypothetical protein
MAPPDTFAGSADTVDFEGEPDEVLKVALGDEVGDGDVDQIEPVLDK